MTMETKTIDVLLGPDEESGLLSALFSTFNRVDKDGDIVMPSAFTHGQKVPLCWSHQWDRPIGAGTVMVDAEGARFEGKFFLDTVAGTEAYKTVKAMSDHGLQEYSWGFRVTDQEYQEVDGQKVRVIKGARVFEVSPVLVGAGEGTRTLAVKSDEPDEPKSVAEQAEDVETRAAVLVESTKGLHERRAKEGRMLSDRNRTALVKARDAMQAAVGEVDALLTASEPQPAKAASEEQRPIDARRVIAEAQFVAAHVLAELAV